jgi:hypothetical protein
MIPEGPGIKAFQWWLHELYDSVELMKDSIDAIGSPRGHETSLSLSQLTPQGAQTQHLNDRNNFGCEVNHILYHWDGLNWESTFRMPGESLSHLTFSGSPVNTRKVLVLTQWGKIHRQKAWKKQSSPQVNTLYLCVLPLPVGPNHHSAKTRKESLEKEAGMRGGPIAFQSKLAANYSNSGTSFGIQSAESYQLLMRF